MLTVVLHFVVASAFAALIGVTSVKAGWLTTRGAAAAVAIGGSAGVGGIDFVILLLAFFFSSSLLSRRHSTRHVSTAGPRGARQVLANGAMLALAAFGSALTGGEHWLALAAGAAAAATSDTWSTEIGMRFGGTPRHLLHWTPVPPGTSGAVTAVGTLAALAGASFISVAIALLPGRTPPLAVFAGGVAGSAVDSLLGATLQERRWCPHCSSYTERRLHRCGHSTTVVGGVTGLDNDVANLLATLAGGIVTWMGAS